MAGNVGGFFLMICRLLMVLICLVRTASVLGLQEKDSKHSVKSLQESAIKDLVKVVEKHFDKLTARMTALENTVSSMQFYSIRQFNQISGSLQTTNNDLGTVRKQVNQIEVDGRSQKIGLSLLGRDMAELKKTSADLLSELETSTVYVIENMEKQGDLIRAVMEDSVIKTAHETRDQISKQIESMAHKNESSETDSINCTVNLSALSHHIDLRFVEFKKQTQAHMIKLVNTAKADLKKNVCTKDQNGEHNMSKEKSTEIICDCKNGRERANSVRDKLTVQFVAYDPDNRTENSSNSEDKTSHVSRREIVTNNISESDNVTNDISTHENVANHISGHRSLAGNLNIPENVADNLNTPENITGNVNTPENVTSNMNTRENVTIKVNIPANLTTQIPLDGSSGLASEEDERVMNALYNMTESVLRAVSYFRNTGRLMEQILSNTDSLVIQQNDLNRRLMIVEMKGHIPSQYGENDSSNAIPGSENEEEQKFYNKILPGSTSITGGCHVPISVFNSIASVIKNGSHLLEVLSDLAQMSSVSLTKATAVLHDEVKRVEGIRTLMATSILAKGSSDESDSTTRPTNLTQRTFKLVEAVASNTGWLPLILHNVQHLESLANRSIQIITQNQEILSQIQQTVVTQDSTKVADEDENDPIFSNRIPRTLGQVEGMSYSDMNTSSRLEAMLNRESLKTIYRTSLQLNRIIPALTKLLSEPDPLITLVGGRKLSQGRVEIYHKSLWGTLCHADLSHLEADLICRHLGFKGGISAGAGHFGSGSGVTWIFNASCLGSKLCSVVEQSRESAQCSHDKDAAVICDHMLKVVSSNGSTERSEGRLEIHHRDAWLPVCADSWTDISARIACQQMGFSNGTKLDLVEWPASTTSTWLGKTTCTGLEERLDACPTDGWTKSCKGLTAAGVSCL